MGALACLAYSIGYFCIDFLRTAAQIHLAVYNIPDRVIAGSAECTGVMYGTGEGPTLGVVLPFDGEPARSGNSVMIALRAGSREDVDKLHALAISLGGAEEGRPGPRGNGSAYCAYFRDLDGNKICVFCTLEITGWRLSALRPGDYVEIPARKKHRVEWTDPKEPTVWLAVYARPR